ncbi:MAG: N-acetyltransferase family protein [Propionicimonas sp.]|uniref:GNAT family N-acetyltransferase n=1 Tax=Propionicimonas sp. TaxID=1955623 RepID=UPI002B209AD3|nr:GNAT family N-acetyltransferase [Propionicimonas sp.]MEA4945778.1 N-acetyltransferase family protein [Propionicimonas sp.]
MSAPTGIVRPATAADAAGCLAIYTPYVHDTTITFETEPPTVQQMAARLADCAASHAWLVYERDGEVIGYAYGHAFAERSAYAWSCETSIYVASQSRGAGAGRALYDALLPALAVRGYRRAIALITQPNEASMALHAAYGFEPAGLLRRVGWKHGAWCDVAWLQRDLGDIASDDPPAALR